MKTRIILTLLTASIMFAVPVNAAKWDDDWATEQTTLRVESDHNLSGVTWVVTNLSGWHLTKYEYRNVALKGTYGYKNSGIVLWSGLVYRDGEITTQTYSNTEPTERPQHQYKTTWKNPQYRKIWNGNQWIDNPDTHSYWEDGRFWVVFPKP